MSKRLTISLFGLILLAVCAAAQDTPTEPAPQPPVPAFGTDNPTLLPASENPPISGLDLPNLEPHGAPLSYLQAGAHFSESVDSNIQNSLGGSSLSTITRALGSLELQRLWSNYDLTLDYLGGVGYYQATGLGLKQIGRQPEGQLETWLSRRARCFQLPARGYLWKFLRKHRRNRRRPGRNQHFQRRKRARCAGPGSANHELDAAGRGGESYS